MSWFTKSCLKTHIAKAYWYYRREKRKSRTFPIIPSEVPRARPRAHLPASGEAGRAPSSTNSARALSLTPPPFSTKLSSSAAAAGATHTHTHTHSLTAASLCSRSPCGLSCCGAPRARTRGNPTSSSARAFIARGARRGVSVCTSRAFLQLSSIYRYDQHHYIRQKLHQYQFQREIPIKFYYVTFRFRMT